MILTLTNKDGQTLDLLNNSNYFVLSATEGLHGIDTDISTIDIPYQDGALIENVKALPRGISLTFNLTPDIRNSLDFFTNIVKSKQYVTLTQIENNKEISIKGIATIPPYSRMLSLCKIQLSIYCGQPYWEDLNTVIAAISNYIDLLYFPVAGQYFTPTGRPFGEVDTSLEKTFINNGDVAVGINIKITALGEVVNPRLSCSTGAQNGWYMQLGTANKPLTLQANDLIEINTVTGNKYITLNGLSTYNDEPLLSYLVFNGTNWLQLETGSNTFNVTTTSGSPEVYFTISYKRRYE